MLRYILICLVALSITLLGCSDSPLVSGEPSGSIAGHVKDRVTGGSIEGAVVTIDDPDVFPVVTNELGNYAITGLKEGSYTVRASKDSYIDDSGRTVSLKDLYLADSVQVEVIEGEITRADMELYPTTGTITGRVTKSKRERDPKTGEIRIIEVGVSKATLKTDPPTSTVQTSSDRGEDKGTYAIKFVREGLYRVIVSKAGFFDVEAQVKVEGGKKVVQNFKLE